MKANININLEFDLEKLAKEIGIVVDADNNMSLNGVPVTEQNIKDAVSDWVGSLLSDGYSLSSIRDMFDDDKPIFKDTLLDFATENTKSSNSCPNKIYTPQEYIEIMTGECFSVSTDNTLQSILLILEDLLVDFEEVKCFDFTDLRGVIAANKPMVLVDCSGFYESDSLWETKYVWFSCPEGYILDAAGVFAEIINKKGDFDFCDFINHYQLSVDFPETEDNSEYIFDWDGDLDQFFEDAKVKILNVIHYTPEYSDCSEFPEEILHRQIGEVQILFRTEKYSIPLYVMDNGCVITDGLCLAEIKKIG